jgi:hypothetical protein
LKTDDLQGSVSSNLTLSAIFLYYDEVKSERVSMGREV